LSKYGARHGLGKADLRSICVFFLSVRCHDEDSFCRDKAALLLELLQTATLRVSQLLETKRPQNGRWIGNSYYNRSEWRNILGLLSEGEGLCQNWNHPRLPLHLLLSRGLPGHDILLDATSDKKTDVETKCPVEHMYPFQLAAIETARGREDGVLISDKRRESLDREQLSRVYLLMRAKPSLVVESHTLDLWQDDEEECEEYVTLLEKESYEIGQGLEQTKAVLEQAKAALENLKKKIANDEQRQACKRRSIENLSMRKKERMTPPSIV
jgi:DNA polymerase III gamma/tau subunit